MQNKNFSWGVFSACLLVIGGIIALAHFTYIFNQSEEEHTEQKVSKPQVFTTVECTSIVGTTLLFSLKTYEALGPEFNEYRSTDKNGVVVVINSSNYGQWKCKD